MKFLDPTAPPKGRTRTIEADVFPGNAIYVEKGGIETAKNVGQQRFHEILIELK